MNYDNYGEFHDLVMGAGEPRSFSGTHAPLAASGIAAAAVALALVGTAMLQPVFPTAHQTAKAQPVNPAVAAQLNPEVR